MVKRCPKCSYNNKDDSFYCSICGSTLSSPSAPIGPSLKPLPSVRVVTPTVASSPIRVQPPGMCNYHPNLPATSVCNRCGKSTCRDCSKSYSDLMLCPQCYAGIVPVAPISHAAPVSGAGMPPPPIHGFIAQPVLPAPIGPPVLIPNQKRFFGFDRAIFGFLLSIIAGVLIIVNAASLLAPGFFILWIPVFFWLPFLGQSLAFIIGIIAGIIVIVGSLLIVLRFNIIGALAVFPLAILSLVIGGGFVAGFVLGVIGALLAFLGR